MIQARFDAEFINAFYIAILQLRIICEAKGIPKAEKCTGKAGQCRIPLTQIMGNPTENRIGSDLISRGIIRKKFHCIIKTHRIDFIDSGGTAVERIFFPPANPFS